MNTLQRLRIQSAIIIISLIYGCNWESEKSKQNETISYSITINKENSKLAKLKVSFVPKDSILYMNPGANNLEKRWATFVHNLQVEDESGRPIRTDELNDAKWKMHFDTNKKITLSYEVHLDHRNYEWSGGIDGAAYHTELGVFYTGRALLIFNGEDWKDINVKFKLPMDWKVTTPWNSLNGGDLEFKVSDFSSLANSIIFAGKHKEVSFVREDFELVFALVGDEIIARETELRNLAKGVLDYYIELMGGIPNSPADSKFEKVVVVINSDSTSDGEAIGNNISILFEKDGDEMSETISQFIFAHEFYHLWSGKSFSPIDESMEWFKEGFTNYYTIKALHHVGVLNDESFLDFIGNFFFKKYINDKGVGKLSMTQGEEKHDHWGLIYSGGLFVGICQDILIRKASNNEKSIDDLMKLMFNKFGGQSEEYNSRDLFQNISELNGTDQTQFYDTYITGTEIIPIEEYLRIAGFNAQVLNKKLVVSKKDITKPEEQAIINGIFGQLKTN